MTMMGSGEETREARPRGQRTIHIPLAASVYDDLEELAFQSDESVNGVIYQAIRNHIDASQGEGFISSR